MLSWRLQRERFFVFLYSSSAFVLFCFFWLFFPYILNEKNTYVCVCKHVCMYTCIYVYFIYFYFLFKYTYFRLYWYSYIFLSISLIRKWTSEGWIHSSAQAAHVDALDLSNWLFFSEVCHLPAKGMFCRFHEPLIVFWFWER